LIPQGQAQTIPEVIWVKQFGGQNMSTPSDMTTDTFGNVYIIGSFSNEINFGDIMLTAPGVNAPFVAKIDTSGSLIWAKQFGGTSYSSGIGITTDSSGNVYSTGTFSGVATFDYFTLDSGNSPDIFVLKQDYNGEVLWVTQFGETNISGSQSIIVDTQGSVYTIGYFRNNITIGNINLTGYNSETRNFFISKQDTSGNVLWVKEIGQTDSVSVEKITTDTSDNLYIIGSFLGTLDFDGITFTELDGKRDFFLTKLNSSGQTVWAKQLEVTTSGSSNYYVYDVNVDIMNNVYVTGSFRETLKAGTTTLTSSSNVVNMFVIKTNNLGEILWAKQFVSTDVSTDVSITTDVLDKVYVTGSFRGSVYFDEIVLTYSSLPSTPLAPDAFVLKMNDLGTVEWVVKYGALGREIGNSITINPAGDVLVLGIFGLSVNFGGTILTSVSNVQDIFLLKLAPNVLSTEINNINNTETLDLSDLTSGIYLLKIDHNQTSQIIKIKKL